MDERKQAIYTPAGGPPAGARPSLEILIEIGEPGIFSLLEAFYVRLAESRIQHFFPTGESEMVAASQKSAAFFVQLLGGRPLFSQHFGPPQMRRRHFPFEIDAAARQEWLDCFAETLKDTMAAGTFPAAHEPSFSAFLESFSSWMVNVAPD